MFRFGRDRGISSTQAYKRCSSSSSIMAAIAFVFGRLADGCPSISACGDGTEVPLHLLWLAMNAVVLHL